MTKVCINENWWTDPRRYKLIEFYQGKSALADGLYLEVLKLAEDRRIRDYVPLIPLRVFRLVSDYEYLLEIGIANLVVIPVFEVSSFSQGKHFKYLQTNKHMNSTAVQRTLAEANESVAMMDQCHIYIVGT